MSETRVKVVVLVLVRIKCPRQLSDESYANMM